jgi:hypothetical protein
MCNDKQGIDLYPATSAIKKKTSLTITFNLPHNANVVWKMQMPGQIVMSILQ